MGGQLVVYLHQLFAGEAIIFSKFWRSAWAVQFEHGFTPITDDVDMCWAVVVGIDHNTQPEDRQYLCHIKNLSGWVCNLFATYRWQFIVVLRDRTPGVLSGT